MVFTQESIDPQTMTALDVRSIADDPALMQAYALHTVAEVSAAVNTARPTQDPAERAWRIYDKLDEVLWDRLQDSKLVAAVMSQSGEFGPMHERNTQMVADKEVRKMLDSMSMRHDVPRACLAQIKNGVAFNNVEDGITFHTLGQMPINFKTDADFAKWAAAEGVPKRQSTKALEIIHATRSLANMTTEQQNAPAASKIGTLMPRPEWEEAVRRVSTQEKHGNVVLPKASNEYSGKVIFMTDTHLVQQVAKHVAFVHDLSKLDNGQELQKAFDDKKIVPGTNMVIKYGPERGVGEIVPFNVQMAREVKKSAIAWAEEKIPNDRTRAAFVKHLEAYTQDMAKGYSPQLAKPALAPRAPERAPQIERPH